MLYWEKINVFLFIHLAGDLFTDLKFAFETTFRSKRTRGNIIGEIKIFLSNRGKSHIGC